MKKGLYQWVFASLGYLVYTLIVIVFLLWVLFPADSFRLWLQAGLNSLYPALKWEIEDVQTALPIGLQISGINIRDDDVQDPAMRISNLKLTPPLVDLFRLNSQVPVMFQAKTFDGVMQGKVSFDRKNGSLSLSGSMEDIELGELKGVWKQLNRPVSGKLSGYVHYMGIFSNALQGNLQADLTIGDGNIGLMQPVLGLENLEFTQAKSKISMNNAVIQVEQGEVESRLFAGSYSGTITLADSLSTSEVDIQGFFEPRSELLGNMQDETTVALIRTQLQDGKLSYTVNGTLIEPGILFEGMSGIIDGIIEGGLR